MSIDLIALDLDDTLLRADLTISARNRSVLCAASARGVKIVLASGRNIHSMKRYAEELDAAGPGEFMICTNGAEIMETATGQRVYQREIGGALCQEIAAAITARGFSWLIYEGGKIFASQPHPWNDEDVRLTGQGLEVVRPEDVPALLSRGHTKFVVPAEPERIAILRKEMSVEFAGRAEVLTSKPYLLEILSDGVDKGDALARLCAQLGIEIGRTIACGDAVNDLGMLKAAGLGCCPANAIAETKAVAGHISALTNEEDFVADVVERFVLAGAASKPC